MGCASSSETKTDYVTGQKKTTHKLGGSYPGNRRQPMKPYAPPASQFSNGQATGHFVSYGGGNALVLKMRRRSEVEWAGSPLPQEQGTTVGLLSAWTQW